jgi:hypothetical protein
MNVGIGTGAAEFNFWEYLFRILGILSLQCVVYLIVCSKYFISAINFKNVLEHSV